VLRECLGVWIRAALGPSRDKIAAVASGHAVGGTRCVMVASGGAAVGSLFWVFIQFGRAGSGGVARGGTVPVCR
jgi:hypothetical protein